MGALKTWKKIKKKNCTKTKNEYCEMPKIIVATHCNASNAG